ncbi:carboxylesterase [Caldibacillus lycopersici]|uniref:Carboxylesterase n=1 Tax=Perspicuibacillus lycopersici TaxID=1325689 RepID=A0AAE3IU77_9BACI|nr:carboxylesterase [Perspicuibacillus lycopersici]MCU9612899.1 carboxylesterase [Perspicuibacillus lycopersici]
MKVSAPKAFTFHGGKRAVLLLHGFTGNSADVRMLGRFLEKNGYTCHAPIYRGHGVAPEELLKYTPEDWWKDVNDAYEVLKNMGHDEIAAVGLSLGGVFSLKLGYSVPVKGIVPMCAPMYLRSQEIMYQGLLEYAKGYKKLEGKTKEQIDTEMTAFEASNPKHLLQQNQKLIDEVRNNIDMIYAPVFVVQARNDGMINPDSANIIYNEVESTNKSIKWYEQSGHVITMDKEKEQLHDDILQFLNQLDWKE